MYGGAALLIRETARRTGSGWPTIVLLAAAFGVLQAGLVDQSLLNPAALDDTEFAGMAAASRSTVLPGLGISFEQALDFIGNHVALSICAPIAIVESFVAPPRRQQSWVGGLGLAVIAVLYVLDSILIFKDTAGSDGYAPATVQLVVVGGLVLMLGGVALLPSWRRRRIPTGRPAVHPAWVGGLVLAAQLSSWLGSGGLAVAIRVAAFAVTAVVIVAWSRHPGWAQPHVLGAWSAGLVVAAATAYVVPAYKPASPAVALASDIAVSIITLTLLGAAFWRLRLSERRAPAAPGTPRRRLRRQRPGTRRPGPPPSRSSQRRTERPAVPLAPAGQRRLPGPATENDQTRD